MNPDYTLTPVKGHEVELRVPPLTSQGYESRGALLAKALRGRYASSQAFYLTPARARKWETLYKAGFAARQLRVGHDNVWRFAHPHNADRWLPLVDAVKKAGAILTPQLESA